MIIVKQGGEEIAYAKNVKTVDDYFKLRFGHNGGNERLLNKVIFSKKYNINVVLIDNKEIWRKNQSIVFLKKLDKSE